MNTENLPDGKKKLAEFTEGNLSVLGNTVFEHTVFGHIAWLWINSPLHKEWPLALLGINVIPAIAHAQYMLLTQHDLPVAYCSWAWLSPEAEKKYLADVNSLTLTEWLSGERLWIIDWVAPFGHSFELFKKMRAKFPNAVARAIRVDRNKNVARVQEILGKHVNKNKAHQILGTYFHEIAGDLKN